MRKTFLVFLFLLLHRACFSQSLSIDIKRDWYGEVATIDISMLDTIVLYPVRGNINSQKDVFIWHYLNKTDYSLEVRNTTQPEIRNPYIYAPEKWKIKEEGQNELYLVMKDHKDPQLVHKFLGEYKLVPYRDNLNILYKIMLVRIYSNRSTQQVKAPVKTDY
jgi:hypothetical protein